MNRSRVFLGSNGLGALEPWLDELPHRPATAVVIPTAANRRTHKPWEEKTFRTLAALGIHPRVLDLEGASRHAVEESLAAAGLVFVTGGDPLFLLEQAQRSGFCDLVPPLVWAGRLAYAGMSAGAMLAGPDLVHCIDPDEPGGAALPSTRGLGIAPVVTLPHASRAGRDLLYTRITEAFGDRLQFARITDEQAIVVQAERWAIRPSPGP